MIRSAVYKDDSFLVEFKLKNELSETIKEGHCITNVDENLFDVLRSGGGTGVTNAGPVWWTCAPNKEYIFTQWLRKKPETSVGYYRFKQPLFKYKLASDADTDPYRAVYGEPPEVIFTDVPLVFCLDLDETRPYNADFAKNIKKVFRVVDKPENVCHPTIWRDEAFYTITNSRGEDIWNHYNFILLGQNPIQGLALSSMTASADIIADIVLFGYNLPSSILVAKANETVYYYDLTNINDGEGDSNIIPIVKKDGRAYMLLKAHGATYSSIIITENSWLQRDLVYNLIANIFGILHSSNLTLNYYDLITGKQKTFELPDTFMTISLLFSQLKSAVQSDGSLKFTSNQQISDDVIDVYNLSKTTKTITEVVIEIDGQTIHSNTVNKTIGVKGYIHALPVGSYQLPADGAEFSLKLLDENDQVIAHITRKCTFVSV